MKITKEEILEVKDHSVSKEIFNLVRHEKLDLLYTHPKPEGDKLSAYYESDDYISHTDGKRSIFEKIYQLVKQIALKRKVKLLERLQPNRGLLLDIGAGTGDFLSVAKSSGWNVSATEPSLKARTIAESKGILFTDSTQTLPENSFDAITMWHVLEHVPDPTVQIEELKRLLKPGGVIIIAVPNYKSHDAKIYGKFWAAFDVPRHLWHFSSKSIERLAEQSGLHLVETLPMLFDAFYVSLLSEKYRTGRMNPARAFLNGLNSNWKARKSGEYSSLIYVIRHK